VVVAVGKKWLCVVVAVGKKGGFSRKKEVNRKEDKKGQNNLA